MDQSTFEKVIARLEERIQRLEEGKFGDASIQCNGVMLADSTGRPQALLAVLESGPRLGFIDQNGNVRLSVGLVEDEAEIRPTLSLHSKSGTALVQLSESEGGAGEARFLSSDDGKVLLHVGARPDRDGSADFGLALIDDSDVGMRATWSLYKGAPSMTLCAEDGSAMDFRASGSWNGIAWVDPDGQATYTIDGVE